MHYINTNQSDKSPLFALETEINLIDGDKIYLQKQEGGTRYCGCILPDNKAINAGEFGWFVLPNEIAQIRYAYKVERVKEQYQLERLEKDKAIQEMFYIIIGLAIAMLLAIVFFAGK
jgi:hypothetical protein